jgi:hypothetical protein
LPGTGIGSLAIFWTSELDLCRVIHVTRHRSYSPQTIKVFGALAAQPANWRHGYDLCAELGIKSGSLYPILIRLCDRGFLDVGVCGAGQAATAPLPSHR